MKNQHPLSVYIDHTLLKPASSKRQIEQLCNEALEYHFKAVCVPPSYVSFCAAVLNRSEVEIATVIGFPYGYHSTASKLTEIYQAAEEGAHEADIVIQIAALLNGELQVVESELDTLINACKKHKLTSKIIIETGLLSKEQISAVCGICAKYQADFVKTSTGVNAGGAVLETVQFMREILPDNIKIKASGGIKTAEQANTFINAGAKRIGTSSGLQIIGVS